MEYLKYKGFFLRSQISDRQLVGVAYGQEAEQALRHAYAILGDQSVTRLHAMAAFMEQAISLRAEELLGVDSWQALLSDSIRSDPVEDAALRVRAIAGDLNLWLQFSASLSAIELPKKASFGEMLAVFALWKGQCQAELVNRITTVMRHAPSAESEDRTAEAIRLKWATLTVELTQLWGALADLGVELSRAATLAQASNSQAERLRQAGRAGADKRASTYMPIRERAISMYRAGSYRSRSAAADDVFGKLRAEGVEISRGSVYSYFSEIDREIKESRKRNRVG